MFRLSIRILGAGLLAAILLAQPLPGLADSLHWRPGDQVQKSCDASCDKSNFSDDVLRENCQTQCREAMAIYLKWRDKPCTDANRAGCFGDVMSRAIGMLPAERQAWVWVADYGCKNK